MPTLDLNGTALEPILLVVTVLVIISVLASRVSSSFGVPSLLLFLGIGMLAGSEGPGKIAFDDYSLAFSIGSVCLAIIMFDGGLRTSWRSVRPILPLGASLSFVGTVVTGVITGLFARFFLNLSWLEGLLLGAIVSSTDAAAVFSILRARSLSLRGSLKQTLEFEAGSNDPVAIFMTVGILMLMTSPDAGAGSLLLLFLNQAGVGLLFGWLGGKGMRGLINHVGIEYEGLYSVLLLALVLFLFAITSSFNGSGFLAVYVAGLVLSNSEFLYKGTLIRFQDGMAWISQILVFLTLGLLAFPSHLLAVWKEGLALAVFMMFVARPLSVFVAAPGKALRGRERYFVSWIGLRGAAPVILATLPWSVNIPNAEYYFNLVFFVVLISVVAQGISIPWVAKKLEVTEAFVEEPSNDFSGLLPAGFVSVEIDVNAGGRAENQRVVELDLPPGVLLTSLQREGRYLVPRGDTVITAGDKVWGLARPSNIESLRELFGEVKTMT